MTISAVLSFWSLRLFPGRGTFGFTAALIGVAAGSVVGPALAGVLAEAAGLTTAFLVTAAAPLTATLFFAGRALLRQT
jgi:dipeptide/tripeptide permease